MKKQYINFCQKYDDLETGHYQISIENSFDFNHLLLGRDICFYRFSETDDSESIFCRIDFSIFNCEKISEFWDMADSISGNLEFVASSFMEYCVDDQMIGSIAIVDRFVFFEQVENFDEKIFLIMLILKKLKSIFNILGIRIITLMTKALILKMEVTDRVRLVNNLMEIGFIPIYQDDNDVVVASNLEIDDSSIVL